MGHVAGGHRGRGRSGRRPPDTRPPDQGGLRLSGRSRRSHGERPGGRAPEGGGCGTTSAPRVRVVLDAYAVVAALVGEPAGRAVEPHLAGSCLGAANLSEVVDVCVRVHGNDEETVRERIDWLVAGGLEVVPLDLAMAIAAGVLRARRYRKRECEISMGDCMAAALAASRCLPLATADPHLARASWAEGVQVLPLPDGQGRRPRRV